MQGLNTALPGLVTHLYTTMSTQYAAYKNSSIRDPKTSPHVVVLNRGLGLLQRLVPWMPIELLTSESEDLIGVFLALMSEEPMLFEALSCMRQVCMLKTHTMQVFERLLTELPQACIKDTPGGSSSSGTLTSSNANSSDNQLYKALQLRTDVAGCLADLLLHNMYAIMHGQQGASMKEEALRPGSVLYTKVEQCYELLMNILQLPSMKMMIQASPLLLSWSKDVDIIKLPFIQR
eukprot:2692-Heterococcus_DN1.PRE.2